MKMNKSVKKSFVVIGKEGSTLDGDDFIQKLWNDANTHFEEVQHLAKKDENGNICGIWGAMSDFSAVSCHGKILIKGFILQVWSAMMRPKRPMAGQNGRFPVTNIFMWNVKVMIFSQRCWNI